MLSAIVVLAVQIGLPLFFIVWLAVWPAPGAVAFAAQALGTGIFLFALALIAVWAMPPWWTPYAFGALWFAAFLSRFWRHGWRFDHVFPEGVTGWLATIPIAAVGLWFGYLSFEALAGRSPPGAAAIDLPFPLKGGTFLIAHGGSREIINAHVRTLEAETPLARFYRGQSYAIDVFEIDAYGLKSDGLQPADPAAYAIFGAPVHAPCAGAVLRSGDGLPDNRVPAMDEAIREGNHVLLGCGDFALLFAHLRKGSVRVKAGDQAAAGTLLGEAGNSGASSEPHLHFHVQRVGSANQPFAAEPVPFTIDGRYLVRNDLVRQRD
jgi:Peptidase family M23